VAGKIFVNYRRDDAKAEAARLHDKLALHFGAANVFMDVDNLLPGERFDLKLQEALAETDIFLAVIGARWQELFEARAASGQRDYVREEIAAALARKIVVIPVPMDRAALPQEESLPPDIRELVLYHKQDVAHESFGRDVEALASAIEGHRQAKANKGAEAARLAREKEHAEIEAARRARQRAKEAAEAERRALENERRAQRPSAAGLPWKSATTILAFAAVAAAALLIIQPSRQEPPQVSHTQQPTTAAPSRPAQARSDEAANAANCGAIFAKCSDDRKKYGCAIVRFKSQVSQCDMQCSIQIRDKLIRSGVSTYHIPKSGTFDYEETGCIAFRSDLGGTSEGAECLRELLGDKFKVGQCGGAGWAYNIIAW
jgi:hypothetical protein